MSIAGHIDRRMMSHYSHIRKQARRAALEQLGKQNFSEGQLSLYADRIGRRAASRNEGHNQGTVAPEMVQPGAMPFSQLAEKNGGDDETRTRDLCRDRAAF